MAEAVKKDEADKIEVQQQIVAWQTALLMNATGNYKKQIKPSDLLGNSKTESNGNRLDRDAKNKRLDELKKKFNQPT